MVANDTLFNLIDNEDWDGARKFLSSVPTDGSEDDFMVNILYQDDRSGETTLMLAVIREARTDIIASLIGKGGKELVMMKDNSGWTALHVACYKGPSVEVVKLLLDVGGDELIVMKTNYGKTVLDFANENNASGEVKDAIRTFDFNTIIKSNRLNNLIDKKDWDGARKFLSSGPTDGSEDDFIANILYQNDWSGWTTLMRAVHNKAPTDIITSLLDKGGKDLVMMKNVLQKSMS